MIAIHQSERFNQSCLLNAKNYRGQAAVNHNTRIRVRLRRERARDIEGRGGRKRERERETDVSPIVPCACGCVPGTDDQLKNVRVFVLFCFV